jgi:membrane fusion protein (multidrug efflux system)
MSDETNESRSSAAPPQPARAAAPAPQQRGKWLRRVLLLTGPLLVAVVAVYVWYTGGRYIETENAFVKADTVVISTQVAGPIARVDVEENQRVHAGDVLFEIDAQPFEIAVARADAQMEAVSSMIESVKASYRQQLEQLALAQTDYEFAQRDLERETRLAEQKLGSEAAVDTAKHDYEAAARKIRIVQRGLEQLQAQLGGAVDGSVSSQPAYRAVASMRDAAKLDLEHAVVRAPIDGVASRVPVVGHYASPGAPIMSVVSDHDLWVEANYKETELTHVCVGQSVEIHVDTYPDASWRGAVESISQATGAEFSVIPAQNATGNWVKVIQRIPVRIALHDAGVDALRSGMSATVSIDTGYQRHFPTLAGGSANAAAAAAPGADCPAG